MWMPRDSGFLADGVMTYDTSSKLESKRSHAWLTDAEIFGKKNQALETNGPISGRSNLNASLCEDTSCFQPAPGHFADPLFGSEPPLRSSVLSTANLAIGRKAFEIQLLNDLSMSVEDPASCLNYGGIKKLKVNQVKESENGVSISLNHSYNGGDNKSSISTVASYDNDNLMSLSTTHNYSDDIDNAVSIRPNFSKSSDQLISKCPISKGDANFISIGNASDGKEATNSFISTMTQTFNKGGDSFISMGQPFSKCDRNTVPMTNHDANFISPITPVYNQHDGNFISMGAACDRNKTAPFDKAVGNIVSIHSSNFCEGDSSIISIGHSYQKGERNSICFGEFPGEGVMRSCSSKFGLSSDQLAGDAVGRLAGGDLVHSNSNLGRNEFVNNKNKELLKSSNNLPPNNFPSNVKSLLSTGMLDGVPVKYVSWSREKNVKGVIKGSGYLCGCNDCNLSMQCLNAFEFERHAGCKTKHPNNHIYFENGKTIYAVVQELKSTPQEMLFEAIQGITGSPLNHKNFSLWKASYEAATRELQRIYGKDEVVMPLQ